MALDPQAISKQISYAAALLDELEDPEWLLRPARCPQDERAGQAGRAFAPPIPLDLTYVERMITVRGEVAELLAEAARILAARGRPPSAVPEMYRWIGRNLTRLPAPFQNQVLGAAHRHIRLASRLLGLSDRPRPVRICPRCQAFSIYRDEANADRLVCATPACQDAQGKPSAWERATGGWATLIYPETEAARRVTLYAAAALHDIPVGTLKREAWERGLVAVGKEGRRALFDAAEVDAIVADIRSA